MKYPSLRDARLEGRRVFLRADLNVPLSNGEVADDTRITAVLPTLRDILSRGASVVIASHLGRPDGSPVPEYSLAPVARRLQELLGSPVILAPDCVGKRVETMATALRPGDILLLENLRFHPGEEEGDMVFAKQLASLAEVYVNDAFGTCHRAHASMTGIPQVLGGGYVGYLVERELDFLLGAVSDPRQPMTLVLGGAKVSDKVPVIENLLDRTKSVLIGGAMAFTFMKARGMETGRSLVEADRVPVAGAIMEKAAKAGVRLLLPVDVVVAPSPDEGGSAVTVEAGAIPPGMMGLDVGEATVKLFDGVISTSGTVVWNGPMGLFEKKPFDIATRAVAKSLARATGRGAVTIVGGGDSARAVSEAGAAESVSFVSTGGGVSLELLQGRQLPALKALLGDGR